MKSLPDALEVVWPLKGTTNSITVVGPQGKAQLVTTGPNMSIFQTVEVPTQIVLDAPRGVITPFSISRNSLREILNILVPLFNGDLQETTELLIKANPNTDYCRISALQFGQVLGYVENPATFTWLRMSQTSYAIHLGGSVILALWQLLDGYSDDYPIIFSMPPKSDGTVDSSQIIISEGAGAWYLRAVNLATPQPSLGYMQ